MNEDLRTEEEILIESIPQDFLEEELAKLKDEFREAKYFWAPEFHNEELKVERVTPKGYVTYVDKKETFIPFDKVTDTCPF